MEDSVNTIDVKTSLKQAAADLGFDAFGVADIELDLRKSYYKKWIHDGWHGNMEWMERNNERRLNPNAILDEARSIIALGISYYQPEPKRRGRIAKYALGADYHKIVYKKLKRLCTQMREFGGQQKPYVDTGPVLEKPIAQLAGLGWQGKSTILLNKKEGTWLFLGVIMTTLDLEADKPASHHCGKCTRCISACPTDAIVAPYKLDARKCISYLTIEHKGSIPLEYRELIGDRVYGCDECLDVCPWNRWAQQTRESKFLAKEYPDLREMLDWTEDDFNQHFSGTPIKRVKLRYWLRNVCVVLGNIGTVDDLPALSRLEASGDELLQEHAHWAIERIKKLNALSEH